MGIYSAGARASGTHSCRRQHPDQGEEDSQEERMIDAIVAVLMIAQFQITPWLPVNGGNCVDVSSTQALMLRSHGFDAFQVKGHCNWHPDNVNHAFVMVRHTEIQHKVWYADHYWHENDLNVTVEDYFDINGVQINNGGRWNCIVNN
jgi:hypothetical protein